MKSSVFALALVLVTGLFHNFAFAAPEADEEGKASFTKAKRYFEAEEYEAALPLFRKAYERSGKRPSTIFGLAQCLRVLKRYEEAIQRFEEYLNTDPDDRAEVEETIALLKDLEADRKRQAASATPAPTPTPPVTKPAPAPTSPNASPKPEPTAPPPAPPSLVAPDQPKDPALTVTATPEEDDDSLFESPWFWVVTGAVVVGAGVAIGVAAGSSGDPTLYGGSTNVVLIPGQ